MKPNGKESSASELYSMMRLDSFKRYDTTGQEKIKPVFCMRFTEEK